jgi:hypothetical protein
MVSQLVPAAAYPQTNKPPPGQVDPPGPQTSVAMGTVTLPNAGQIDVCAMILPVYWDVAAILIAREIESFDPNFIMMNGVDDTRQPLYIELGAVNSALVTGDASTLLAPVSSHGKEPPLVPTAPSSEWLKGLFLSWTSVRDAALSSVTAHANDTDGSIALRDRMSGVRLAGFPRVANTHLCNNISYVVSYLTEHPQTPIKLLVASTVSESGITISLGQDRRSVPRGFFHWPTEVAGAHIDSIAQVALSIMDAQLGALASGEAPTVGDNSMADVPPDTGSF